MNHPLRTLVLFPIGLWLLATAAGAHAEMQLDNFIIVFEPGQPARKDVTVSNTGEQPLYLKVTPFAIEQAGTSRQTRRKIVDPRKAGLLITPNKLVIPPGGRKRIRFVNLDPARSEEGVFRVTIEPVAGELQASASGVKVMVGYEVLVLAQPHNPRPDIRATRDGNRLVLHNRGNTDVYLFRGKQCRSSEGATESCTELRDRRLYPGNEWVLELPHDGPVEFHLAIGNKNTLKTFN